MIFFTKTEIALKMKIYWNVRKRFKKETQVIYFDEFQVTNIVDALIYENYLNQF